MTHPGGAPNTPSGLAQWVQANQAEKLAGRVQDALEDPDFDVDDLDDLVEEIAASAPPPPPPAPPATQATSEASGDLDEDDQNEDPEDYGEYDDNDEPESVPDAERDETDPDEARDVEPIQLPPLQQPTADRPIEYPGLVVDATHPNSFEDGWSTPSPVDPPEWDRYGRWSPPKQPDIIFPDDVETLTPAAHDSPSTLPAAPIDDTANATGGHGSDAPDADEISAEPGTARIKSLLAAWAALPKRARIALPAAGAALAVILLIALLPSGSTPQAPTPSNTQVPVAPTTAVAASDGPLIPKSALAPGCPAGSSPDAKGAFDPDPRRAWICARRFVDLDHTILYIEFDEPVVISEIKVTPGFDYVEANGEDRWNQHRLVTDILWRIGGKAIPQKINPTRAPADLAVPNLATTALTATIRGTTRPSGVPKDAEGLPGLLGTAPTEKSVDESFAIGRIEIFGHPAGGSR